MRKCSSSPSMSCWRVDNTSIHALSLPERVWMSACECIWCWEQPNGGADSNDLVQWPCSAPLINQSECSITPGTGKAQTLSLLVFFGLTVVVKNSDGDGEGEEKKHLSLQTRWVKFVLVHVDLALWGGGWNLGPCTRSIVQESWDAEAGWRWGGGGGGGGGRRLVIISS